MAEPKFPSKHDDAGKEKPFRFQAKNSLGFRILVVCVLLMLLPTYLYSLHLLHKIYRLKIREIAQEIFLIGTSYEGDIERFITSQEQNLATWNIFSIFEDIRKEEKPCAEYCSFFQQIASKQKLTSLFFIKKDPATSKFLYYISNQPDHVGKEVYFTEELNQVGSKTSGSFLAKDPITDIKEIYFVLTQFSENGTPYGYLVSGLPAIDVLHLPEYQEAYTHQFDISLLDAKGDIYVTTNANISLANLEILSFESVKEEEEAEFPLFQSSGNLSRAVLQAEPIYFGLQIPIKDVNYSLLIDVPDYLVFSLSARNDFISLLFIFFGILLVGSLVSYWLAKRMAMPLSSLANLMSKVGEGVLSERYNRDKMGFEINELGNRFNQMILSLVDYIERANTEKIAKETLAKELLIGREIQKTILPWTLPEIHGLDLAAGFISAKEVGGDFYDLLYKEEHNKLAFAIADTSGKGVSACLYSLSLRGMLRSYEALYDNVETIIQKSNDLFYLDTSETGMFVTAWLGMFDVKSRQLQYSSCGHLPAILFRSTGEIIELTTTGIAFGVIPMEQIISSTVELYSGDFLVLYTDGIIEAHNKVGNLFGKRRMIEILQKTKGLPSKEIISTLFNAVDEFVGDFPRHDDSTIFVLRITE